MNKFQRAGAGIYGAIENTLDDLRHTWERVMYGREITGDVNMFPHIHNEPEPQPDRESSFERLYGKEQDNSKEQARESVAPKLEVEMEMER